MTELNLPVNAIDTSEQEVMALKEELAALHHRLQAIDQAHEQTIENLKSEVELLKSELNNTESTSKALQRSLQQQLHHNWEQQHHELIAEIANLRDQDQAKIKQQEEQIQLLQQLQQELSTNLDATRLELAQTTKQKLQSNSKNIPLQVVLEQSIRHLQVECITSANRIKELESQVSELQEQILQQSGQATEYEAAVQHWREKCLIHQSHAAQLSNALEKFIDGKDIPKMLEALKVDLPAFLVKPRP